MIIVKLNKDIKRTQSNKKKKKNRSIDQMTKIKV